MNIILFIFSCFHLIYLDGATWRCSEVHDNEQILKVDLTAVTPPSDQLIPIRYLGKGNSKNFGDMLSTPPCQLINYNKDECGGISVKGNLMYNYKTGNPQYVDIISRNKDKTIGWKTKLLIKRIDENVKEITELLHIYKMTWIETFSYSIPKDQSERPKAILSTTWNQKFLNRYSGSYAVVHKENNMTAFSMCTGGDDLNNDSNLGILNNDSNLGIWDEYDPFFILGAWITIPKEDPVDNYTSLSEFKEKYARYRSYNLHFISDIYDDDE